jgi:putative PIN family toxin of toxin-antitoxin system
VSVAPRVVLDTHVVLSALVFAQGRLAPLRDAWQWARCDPLVSTVTTVQLMRALAYPKFKLSPEEQQELLADYLPYCTVVRMPAKPPKTPACRDPFDIPFLQVAIAGKAAYLVTGDKDLLSLAATFPRSIITAEKVLGMLAKD